ncbi:MAG TPA: hypothetical protein PLD88_03620 [Candidatus Berkiella sp.]|nr:hypothetical protein [Candidatus Berkiella sp.]
MKFLLNTTPWENSCGLAALSHVLTQNILTSMKRKPLNQQALNLMLSAFSTIYHYRSSFAATEEIITALSTS